MSIASSGASADAPVSVVIPCHRARETIGRAVASVLEQTRRPLEVLLVDDGGEPPEREALEALHGRHGGWMKLIRLERNAGASAARNAGWEAARGEYVAFLDADDTWMPGKLEVQHAFMRAHPEFGVTGHRAAYGDAPVREAGGAGAPEWRVVTRGSVLLRNPMVTPSLMVRRDLPARFDASRRYMEDHFFLQESVFSGLGVARIERVLARVHKPAFGAGGLSGHLWAMERGDLENYRELRRRGRIGAPAQAALAAYSLAKFARRLALVALSGRRST